MSTDELLKGLAADVRNATIDACIDAAMGACSDKHMKDYPLTVATLICNRLQQLKAA